jgi:CheY-like chemotaxis protein
MSCILVVDDSETALEAARLALEDAHHEVHTLDNPMLLPQTTRKTQPDLILVDVNMPALVGDTAAKVLSGPSGEQPIPLVLFSDRSEADLAVRAKRCGAIGYIVKTSDEVSFVSQVEQLLAQAKTKAR